MYFYLKTWFVADDDTFRGCMNDMCPDNIFTGVKTFEFQDSTDTTWTSNDIGGGCLDGSTDFAKGSIPDC